MKLANSDLLAETKGKTKAARLAGGVMRERNASNDYAGRSVGGGFTVVGSSLEVARIELDLRPEQTGGASRSKTILE
jgi:hypothetical protein